MAYQTRTDLHARDNETRHPRFPATVCRLSIFFRLRESLSSTVREILRGSRVRREVEGQRVTDFIESFNKEERMEILYTLPVFKSGVKMCNRNIWKSDKPIRRKEMKYSNDRHATFSYFPIHYVKERRPRAYGK